MKSRTIIITVVVLCGVVGAAANQIACGNSCVYTTLTHLRQGVANYLVDPTLYTIETFDVSAVTDFNYLFYPPRCIANEDLSQWDTSSVTDMTGILRGCTNANPNIGDWNTAQVTTLQQSFRQAETFNQDLSKWNVAKVKSLYEAFWGADEFNGDISQWNTGSVTTMILTFAHFRTGGFDNFENYDYGLNYEDDVENEPNNFAAAHKFNRDLSKWNTSSVKSLDGTFRGSLFNQDINAWNTTSVTVFQETFKFSKFNQDLSKWDVRYGNNFEETFQHSDFNQDISCWQPGTKLPEIYNTFVLLIEDPFDGSDVSVPPCWAIDNNNNDVVCKQCNVPLSAPPPAPAPAPAPAPPRSNKKGKKGKKLGAGYIALIVIASGAAVAAAVAAVAYKTCYKNKAAGAAAAVGGAMSESINAAFI